jgi:hypothetical protein
MGAYFILNKLVNPTRASVPAVISIYNGVVITPNVAGNPNHTTFELIAPAIVKIFKQKSIKNTGPVSQRDSAIARKLQTPVISNIIFFIRTNKKVNKKDRKLRIIL